MRCYCTVSNHHQCNGSTGKIDCPSHIKHCIYGKSSKKAFQSCWLWPLRTHIECPSYEGVCYHLKGNLTTCCCKGELCNQDGILVVKVPRNDNPQNTRQLKITTVETIKEHNLYLKSVIFLSVLLLFCLLSFLVLIIIKLKQKYGGDNMWYNIFGCYRRRNKGVSKKISMKKRNTSSSSSSSTSITLSINENCKNNKKELIKKTKKKSMVEISEDILDSTVSTHCSKLYQIGMGRFGQIWLASMTSNSIVVNDNSNNSNCQVAIKLFSSEGQKSWKNEVLIYTILKSKPHENILQFYGADKVLTETSLQQYMLVLDYHPQGSLYQYLQHSTLTWPGLISLVQSISTGVAHIHSISPAIAHCDLKSKNILIKSNLSACLADFGLSVSENNSERKLNVQVGTYVYMAPEILEGSLNISLQAFMKVDIFAMALVFWEIISRCSFEMDSLISSSITPESYRPPYDEYFDTGSRSRSNSPTLDQMIEVVVKLKKRPSFQSNWTAFPNVNPVLDTITECWDDDADARLSADCVKKRLQNLI